MSQSNRALGVLLPDYAPPRSIPDQIRIKL